MKDDRLGQLTGLNVAAPLRAGADEALLAAIAAVPEGPASPFARLGTVHFARWVPLPDKPRPGVTTLWFSATFDGTLARFVSGLARHMPAELDAVFTHCVDWPGARDRDALERWMRARRIPVSYFLAAYPNATLPRIAQALERRRALVELAIEAPHMDAAELHAEFVRRVA
ncbi:MAG TPA: hypothetical protein VFZ89_12800 [Solirubrobacteraceae bacterium]